MLSQPDYGDRELCQQIGDARQGRERCASENIFASYRSVRRKPGVVPRRPGGKGRTEMGSEPGNRDQELAAVP